LAELVLETVCTISKDVLRTTPFNLQWGDAIYAYVVATNVYGDSAASPAGNGALLITSPDAPINLVEDLVQRSETTLGLKWNDGQFNGGVAINAFTIS
jgi:hypothetical protein